MADNGAQSFDAHPMFQKGDGEGAPQIIKSSST
jgi:hypothetical protein